MAKNLKIISIFLVVVSAIGCSSFTGSDEDLDWRSNWAVQSGFDLVIDVEGFTFPTAIAFVPNPGPSPKDPLYFVAEIQGRVRVITNDRSIFTFAENFFTPPGDLVGMAGICLDSEHGYVFVTFSHQDSGTQFNDIMRFQTTPEIFSISPSSQIRFTEVFAPYPYNGGHQIGPCSVDDSLLYVSTGDGNQQNVSQALDSLLGKVLRMTLDGKPVPDNPFYQDDVVARAANFVWAAGFRNPFGLEVIEGQVFVADNGWGIDRFLRVEEGYNALWDGNDLSIGTNADAVISPGHGVAQFEHYPVDSNIFPDRFQDSFYLTLTGAPEILFGGIPAILQIPYGLTEQQLSNRPRPVLQYRGESDQIVAGLAFGPDGLYFAPLVPIENGMSPVLKLQHRPSAEYPNYIDEETNPHVLMQTHGCFACHSLNNNSSSRVGPILDRDVLLPRIREKLDSEEYATRTQTLDLKTEEPFVAYREARQSIKSTEGIEQIRLWLENRIQEPRFDDPNAVMPNLGLSPEAARNIANLLAGTEAVAEDRNIPGFISRVSTEIRSWFPTPSSENAVRYLITAFASGLIAGALGILVITQGFLYLRKRSRADQG